MAPHLLSLIAQLASPLPEVREQARAELRTAGAAAVAPLTAALSDENRDVRGAAALLLGELRAGSAVPGLAQLARADEDNGVRALAVRALSDLAHSGAGKALKLALTAQLGAPDMFCRALACRGLGRIGDEHCREALRIALKDREEWVRNAAQQALAGGPVPAPGAPAAAGSDAAEQALVATGGAGPPAAVARLVQSLRSLDLGQQRQAQAELATHGTAAVRALAPLLWDAMPAVRRAAAETLGSTGVPEALDALAQVIADEHAPAALHAVALHAAAQALARCGAVDRLPLARALKLLEANDEHVRAAAGHALIRAGGAARATAFRAAVDDEDEWVLQVACRALGEAAVAADRGLRDDVVEALAQSAAPAQQAALLEALRRLLADPLPEDQTVVPPVSFFLRSADPAVRRSALALIRQVARRIDDPILEDLLQIADEDRSCAAAVVALLPLATSPRRAVPALERALRGADLELARAAVDGLAKLGDAEAIEALVRMANSRQGPAVALAAQALAAFDPSAELTVARAPDGKWSLKIQRRCACGGELRWIPRDEREELRCGACDREYVLSAAGKLFDADRAPLGSCLCCSRKQLLVRRGDTQVLVCSASGEVHVRPFDHPHALRLLRDLPAGACLCCAEPQPLVRVDERLLCYRTRRAHVPGAAGPELADGVADDVDAINRALLEGTLGIGVSGVARIPRRRS